MYYVDNGVLKSLDFLENFKSNKVYLIIDKSKGVPKIWIWVGDDASVNDRYHAGMLATKVKSQMQFFSAEVEIIDEVLVPSYFPNFSEMEIEKSPIDTITSNNIGTSNERPNSLEEISAWFDESGEEKPSEPREDVIMETAEEVIQPESTKDTNEETFEEENLQDAEAETEEEDEEELEVIVNEYINKPDEALEEILRQEFIVISEEEPHISTRVNEQLIGVAPNSEETMETSEDEGEEIMEELWETTLNSKTKDPWQSRIDHIEKIKNRSGELFGLSDDDFFESIGRRKTHREKPIIEEETLKPTVQEDISEQIIEETTRELIIEKDISEPTIEEYNNETVSEEPIVIMDQDNEQIEEKPISETVPMRKDKVREFLVRVSYLIGELQDTINDFLEDLED